MKNNQNINMINAPMGPEPPRRDLAWRWPDRRFIKRLLCMLVVVSLLFNTLGIVVDDAGIWQNRLASAENLDIGPGAGGYETGMPSGELELDDPLADDFDGSLDQVGDLSLTHNLASVAPGEENAYAYQLTGETSLLLSDLVEELKIPIEEMKLVENVSLLGNEQDPTIDMSLFVSIVAMDEDYLIYLRPGFAEAKLNVYTATQMFTIRLVNDPTLTTEEVALAALALSEDPSAFEPPFSYDFESDPARVRLSWLLEQVGLSIKAGNVTDVGVLEINGDEGDILDIKKLKRDYRLTALRNFTEVELAVFTDSDIYTIALKNGGAYQTADGSDDQGQDEDGDVGRAETPKPGEQNVDLEHGTAVDFIGAPGIEADDGAGIGLEIEQVLEPVSEPVEVPASEPEIEPVAQPESEPVTEPESGPVTEPESGPVSEPVSEPESGPVSEPVSEPETEPVSEPVTEPVPEPVSKPESKSVDEPSGEPQVETDADLDGSAITVPGDISTDIPVEGVGDMELVVPAPDPKPEPAPQPSEHDAGEGDETLPGEAQGGEGMEIPSDVTEAGSEPETVPAVEPEAVPEIIPAAEPETEPAVQPSEDAGEGDVTVTGEVQGDEGMDIPSDVTEAGGEPETVPEVAPVIIPAPDPKPEPAPQPGEDAGEGDVTVLGEAQGGEGMDIPSDVTEAGSEPEAVPEIIPAAEPETEPAVQPSEDGGEGDVTVPGEAQGGEADTASSDIVDASETGSEPAENPGEGETGSEPAENPDASETGSEPGENPDASETGSEPAENPGEGETGAEPAENPDASETGSEPEENPGASETDAEPAENPNEGDETVTVPEDAQGEAPVGEPEDAQGEETEDGTEIEQADAPVEEPAAEPEAGQGDAPAAPIAYPAVDFTARVSGVTVSVVADKGAFPEGTTMKVQRIWDADTLSDVRESVADDFTKVKRVQAVDIAFYDADNNEIEPRIPISVTISVSEITEEQSATVLHVAENADGRTNLNVEMPASETEQTEVGTENAEAPGAESTASASPDSEPASPEAAGSEATDDAFQAPFPASESGEDGAAQGVVADEVVSGALNIKEPTEVSPEDFTPKASDGTTDVAFEADTFSVYVVVVTETISTHYIDASGNTWNVEVSYGPEAGIPSGATLSVSELTGDAADAYAARAAEALNVTSGQMAYAKALDIAILVDGVEKTPTMPVYVSIKLLDAPEVDENTNINVLHFGKEVEPVSCALNGENVEFETDGFSVYLVAYTVDFHWGDYTYSIAGESEILLSALFEKLGVNEIALADIEDVTFSNPDLVGVEKLDSDWLLKSLAPFSTEEALVLALKNGQSVEIRVTDEVTLPVSGTWENGTEGSGTWSIDANGVLTLSGTDEMKDYTRNNYWVKDTPWFEYIVKDSTHADPPVTKIVIENGITRIGTNSFTRTYNLNEIDVSNCSSLTTIGEAAFKQQSSGSASNNPTVTKTINFSGCVNLETIEKEAFRDCTGIEELDISETKLKASYITTSGNGTAGFGDSKNSLKILRANGCITEFTSLNLEGWNSLETVELSGCTNLTGMNLPSGVSTLDVSGCTGLTSLTAPSGVTSLNVSGSGLTSLDVSACTGLTTLDVSGTGLTSLNVPSSVTSLNVSGTGLTSLDLSGCASLTELDASDCTSLTSLTVPDSVTSLNVSDCTSLTSLTVPDSVTSLNVSGCTGLTSLNVPGNATSLKASGCTGLAVLDLSKTSLTDIDVSNNVSLTALKLPASVTELNVTDCPNLVIYFDGKAEDIPDGILAGASVVSWGDYTYAIKKNHTATLNEVFTACGITAIDSTAVQSISASDPAVLEVTDLKVKCLQSFTDSQTLTVTLKNDMTGAIKVDYQAVEEKDDLNLFLDTGTVYSYEGETVTHALSVPAILEDGDTLNLTLSFSEIPEGEEGERQMKLLSPMIYTFPENLTVVTTSLPQTVNISVPSGEDTLSFTANVSFDEVTRVLTVTGNYGDQEAVVSAATMVSFTVPITVQPSSVPGDYDLGNGMTLPVELVRLAPDDYVPLTREYSGLDGSWAYWTVTVNPSGYTLNKGRDLTLADTFDDDYPTKKTKIDADQSIDYSSVKEKRDGVVVNDYSYE